MTTSILHEKKNPADMAKAEQFLGQFIQDLSANYSGVMNFLGLELGLYKCMHGAGPLTPAAIAEKSGTYERYTREWLNNQAAGGYVIYDPQKKTYELPEEHALVLLDKNSPFLLGPAYYVVSSLWNDKDKLSKAFTTGKGIGWHEHHHDLFHGVEAVYRTGYQANLISTWIPALEGVKQKLAEGARVADIGCGHGAPSILMAEAFPRSQFYGFDYHSQSINTAKQRAAEQGLCNIQFIETDAETYNQNNFDLICFFDCLHDLGNPLKALEYARTRLAPGGTLLFVEPNAADNPADNFHPIGRMFYAASTALCVPHSHSQEGDYCLGAQAGPAAIELIAKQAGFSRCRIAQQTPVNLIFEVKV